MQLETGALPSVMYADEEAQPVLMRACPSRSQTCTRIAVHWFAAAMHTPFESGSVLHIFPACRLRFVEDPITCALTLPETTGLHLQPDPEPDPDSLPDPAVCGALTGARRRTCTTRTLWCRTSFGGRCPARNRC